MMKPEGTLQRGLFIGGGYWPSLEKGSDQLIVTLFTLSIYPSANNLLIQTLLEAHTVVDKMSKGVIRGGGE